ncbi:MAG: DUF1761 domain-containing protein [Beijerinckiaceae bacterium]
MTYAGVNWFAVVLATFAGYMFGAAYYMLLSKPWLAASEFSEVQRARIEGGASRSPAPFIVALLAQALMAYIFAALQGHLGAAAFTVRGGLLSGFFLWAGFVLTSIVTNYSFGMRKPSLILIDSLHWLGVLLIQGTVIGLLPPR